LETNSNEKHLGKMNIFIDDEKEILIEPFSGRICKTRSHWKEQIPSQVR